MVLFCDVLFHFKYHKGLSNSTSRCSVGARDCGGFPIPTMTKIDPPFLQLPIKLFVPPGLAISAIGGWGIFFNRSLQLDSSTMIPFAILHS